MTCIVAIGNPETKSVIMGGDRAISDSNGFIATCAQPKIIQKGQYLIGFAGNIKLGKIIQYEFEPPEYDGFLDLDKFMNIEFCESLKELFIEKEFGMYDHKEGLEVSTSNMLVAIEGRIFEIEYDLAAIEYEKNYAAIGSAADLAMGALYAYNRVYGKKYIKAQIEGALSAASEYSTTCSTPFDILKIGDME